MSSHAGDDGGQAGVNFLVVIHHSWPKHKGRVFGLPNQDYQMSPMNGRASGGGNRAMMVSVSRALQDSLGIPCSGAISFLWAPQSRVLRVFSNFCYKNTTQIYTVVTQILKRHFLYLFIYLFSIPGFYLLQAANHLQISENSNLGNRNLHVFLWCFALIQIAFFCRLSHSWGHIRTVITHTLTKLQ